MEKEDDELLKSWPNLVSFYSVGSISLLPIHLVLPLLTSEHKTT